MNRKENLPYKNIIKINRKFQSNFNKFSIKFYKILIKFQ